MNVDALLTSLKPSFMSLGLERINELLAELNLPNRENNILVAGTNGKGSTAAYLSSILHLMEGQTGLFTSPHLLHHTERIRVDGVPIREEAFSREAKIISGHFSSLASTPTYFEFLTALALEHFNERETRFNVLEVGLGGRLDATNPCRGPVAVISRIAHDHTHILGKTLKEIATEKCGIIKKGQTVVVAPQRPQILALIKKIAHDRGATVFAVQESSSGRILSMDLDGFSLDAILPGRSLTLYSHLTGVHQADNLLTALCAATLLGNPTTETLQRGAAMTRWPGRMEMITVGQDRIILDGAHNPNGARMLAKSMARMAPAEPLTLVWAGFKDKNAEQSLAHLTPLADRLILTQLESKRSMTTKDLNRIRKRFERDLPVIIVNSIPDALKRLTGGETALITGSLYTVSEVYRWLKRSPSDLTTQA